VNKFLVLLIATVVVVANVVFFAPDWSAAARHFLRNLARAF